VDTAVALDRPILRVNGYFTVTEYPIIEAARKGQYGQRWIWKLLRIASRAVTRVPKRSGSIKSGWTVLPPDPVLGVI
jgi:hypothetical protein